MSSHPEAGRKSATQEMAGSRIGRGSVLDEARTIINGARQDAYGKPEDSFPVIAGLWSAYKGVEFTPREVIEMLTLFKIARMRGQKPHRDNYRDAAGYIGLAADMLEENA